MAKARTSPLVGQVTGTDAFLHAQFLPCAHFSDTAFSAYSTATARGFARDSEFTPRGTLLA